LSGIASATRPIDVPGLASGVKDIAAGDDHICAVTSAGGVKCWGYNFQGQLGLGRDGNDLINVGVPTDVVGLSSGVSSISAGYNSTCVVTEAGGVKCWGLDGSAGSGAGLFGHATPFDIPGLEQGVREVSTSGSGTCALLESGAVKCWGFSPTDQPTLVPTDVPGLPRDVSSITSGVQYCVLDSSGYVRCVTARCAVMASGSVRCWDGDRLALPVPNAFDEGVASISRRCLVTKGGGAKCFGYNHYGTVGDGTTTDRIVPADVSGLTSGVASVASGGESTCAVSTAGDAWCWGRNMRGQVGDGTTVTRYTPARVSGLSTREVAASAGPVSGLWWKADESGWGIYFSHRQYNVFAAWYTYDASGNAKWYVASNCGVMTPYDLFMECGGTLYEVSGPPFPGGTFDPAAVRASAVGTLSVLFRDANEAMLWYTVNGQTRTFVIVRQVFASGISLPTVNYTDLWWNPSESGWGAAITHQYGVMFLAWFVYDESGKPVWYVATNCSVNAAGDGCAGTLFRTTGPPFGPTFDPARVQAVPVGTASLSFSDPNNGTLAYTVNGTSGIKAITRQIF
jgi:hypothetical protein